MSSPLDILDSLTEAPASYLFNTASPPYRSAAARQLGAGFKWKTNLSPMLYHSEAGVVLYDRVVTGAQEARMLQKLTKPKEVHPANSAVSTVALSGGAGAPKLTSPNSSPPGSPARSRPAAPAPAQGAASRLTASGAHNGSSHACRGASAAAQHSDPPYAGRKRYTRSLRSESDIETEAANKYFHQQRATMTVTQVFTWGGRLSHRSQVGSGARGPAGARAAAAAGLTPVGGLFSHGDTHRAPLRLDAYHD